MSRVVGIELTAGEARGVRLARWRASAAATHRVPWDPARPAAAIAELRAALGPADRIAIALGLGLLELKRVDLPPAPPAERERMLQLEPDRYFASTDRDLVTGLDDASGMAFAVARDDLTRWLAAFREWAPVERIEASPLAIARVVPGDGHFVLDEGDGASVIELRDRQLRAARRLPPHVDRNGARPLQSAGGVVAPFQAAVGVARGIDLSLTGQLSLPELRADTVRRRQRRVALLGVAATAAMLFAGWSYERWQEAVARVAHSRVWCAHGIGHASAAGAGALARQHERARDVARSSGRGQPTSGDTGAPESRASLRRGRNLPTHAGQRLASGWQRG